jgi:hypothetical protein
MEFVGVVLVYTGLIAAFLAGVSVIKPIRLLGIRTRANALLIFAAGLAVIAVGFALPPTNAGRLHALPCSTNSHPCTSFTRSTVFGFTHPSTTAMRRFATYPRRRSHCFAPSRG